MSTPEIGALRRRITLLAATRTSDAGGGVAVAWTPVTNLWAAMRSLNGTQAVVADGLQGKVTHEFIIRKRTDVTPAMRIGYGARVFVIRAVLDRDGPEPYIRIQAEERMQ